jgi:hypothetical protein
LGVALAVLALPAGGAALAQSDPVAEFYKGKTVSILVGYEGGGGYDITPASSLSFWASTSRAIPW